MAEKKVKWTGEQKRAISARGSDVLVTASAGTGKTAVLSGRYVDVASERGTCPDVCSILVLTFTDMAAEQMRSRIGGQLRAMASARGDRHLRHQVMLLDGADIGTIHSFCKRLITEYFYKLELDPTFRVIDSDEQKLLKAEVLERTIEWAWEQSNLVQGLEQLFKRRDLRTNEGFLSKIIALSDFLDGVVGRERWFERAALLAEVVNPFTNELGAKQKELVGKSLGEIVEQLGGAGKLYERQGGVGECVGGFEDVLRCIVECIESLEAGDWERCAASIMSFKKPVVRKAKDVSEEVAEVIRKTVKGAVDSFEGLCRLAVLNPEYVERVGNSAGLQTKILIELVKKFDRLYRGAKRGFNCMDFADLERYALELLSVEGCGEDKSVPSETALALRDKYKYIFVDEYQDINPVQQAILDMLSGGGNVFVVGDVKQSIYAFRGAEPGIFLEHLERASAGGKRSGGGFRVDLKTNWRSVKGILDFVNKVFSRIMTSSFAKIDYDESARLRPGSGGECEGGMSGSDVPAVELHILDERPRARDSEEEEGGESRGGGERIISSRQRQAMMIAERIKQMVGADGGRAEFQIYDKGEGRRRDVEYGDIVVLMRSPAKRVNDYVEVLRLAGVPVSCETSAGYFEATEISDCLCLLKVLDNPQRDIELAAVLRSPFFNISDIELAKIKLYGKSSGGDKGFYECVCEYARSGSDFRLAGRTGEILGRIERWRTLGRRGKVSDLIWRIYRETGYLSFVSALPNGRVRRANLLKLHERAIQFEGFASSGGVVSLRRFVEFIERLREAGGEWGGAEPEAEVENAVRIMSVHKSKGLEFGVVFLAELDNPFNTREVTGDVLADAVETLGLQVIDRESNTRLDSLAHQVIAERKRSTGLAEEMRILYVAMTRARERLVLSGCKKSRRCRGIISGGFLFNSGEAINDWQLGSCRSALEWVLYGLCDQSSLHAAFETETEGGAADDGLFSLRVYGQGELERLSESVIRLKDRKFRGLGREKRKLRSKGGGAGLLAEVKRSLGWRYGFGDAAFLPAKRSVTELSHLGDEYRRTDYSRVLEREPKAVLSGEGAGAVDGRLVGTAVHLLISELDLSGGVTREAIEGVKGRLVTEGRIGEGVAGRIDAGSIKGFFDSELGAKVLGVKNKVWREWPFTFSVPVSEFWPESAGCSDETIVVQGIIDMLVRTPEGIVVIDFKTDNITAEEVNERSKLYREQLELYGSAAGAILKEETAGRWVYFLGPGCAVEV